MFNIRLKELRKDRKITQEDLAELLGVERSTVGKWESKMNIIPPADMLMSISEYFDVTVDYLLGRTSFKNTQELFVHWENEGKYFEPTFDFGGVLKVERENQDISQKEVAKKLNLAISDINDIEEGVLPINSELADKFAKALNTTVEELFEQNRFWTTYEEPTAIAAHLPEGVKLTEEERRQLEDYIQFILSRRENK
ncbi:MAG: helix-turn-helix transcriptional regulator [Peptostreptococcales bacterium]